MAKMFSHTAYLLQRSTFYKYTNVSAAVLASARFENFPQKMFVDCIEYKTYRFGTFDLVLTGLLVIVQLA